MDTKMMARVGAVGFVAIVLTMTALQMRDDTKPASELVLVPVDADSVDALKVELRRCQALGGSAADDKVCLRAWAQQRNRFFVVEKPQGEKWRDDAGSLFPAEDPQAANTAPAPDAPSSQAIEGAR